MWDESIHLLFPKCEEVLGHIKIRNAHSLYNDKCDKFGDKYSDIFNSNINEICCQSLKYLNEIYNGSDYASLDKAGFKYLYYWLYKYKLKLGKKSTDIKTFYDELIDIYNTHHLYDTSQKVYQSKSDEELEKLKDLHDMHNSLIFIKDKCITKNNRSYCNEILDVVNKYEPQRTAQHNEAYSTKELHNCKNNIVVPIIIPIFIILVISLFWIIIFKLTPYGSYLCNMIKRKRNARKTIYEEWNTMESSEISRYVSNDGEYNVLYNYM